MIKIMPLGGAQEIGANSYYVDWEGIKIMLDCGMDPNKSGYNKLPLLHKIEDEKIDLLFVSHPHLDHLGSLPVIEKIFDVKRIVMSQNSKEIYKIMLLDSAKVLMMNDYNKRFYEIYFNKLNLFELDRKIECIELNKVNQLNSNINFKLFKSGHVIGSCGIHIFDNKGNSLIYTGDFSVSNNIMTGKLNYYKKNVDIMITETTNGNSEYEEKMREKYEGRFIESINKTLEKNGIVLIPAFALGKTQEILFLFERRSKELLTKKIYTVGMANKITPIYRECHSKSLKSKYIEKIDSIPRKSIIIASSGMLNPHTPSYQILKHLIEDETSSVLFTGYLAKGTLGYELLKTEKNGVIYIDEKEYVKKVNVEHFSLSLHSSLKGIISYVNRTTPKNVLLVHGDLDAIKNVKQKLKKEVRTIIGENGKELIFKKGKLLRRKDMKSYIVTVGTAVFGNFRKMCPGKEETFEHILDFMLSNPPEKVSAETNTIHKLKKEVNKNSWFYLIESDTEEGEKSCKLLEKYILEKYKANVERVKIEGLKYDANEFETRGLINFIKKVTNIIDNTGRNIEILATGGFKAEIAYATILAVLYKVPVYYVFEDFNSIVKLPEIPIEFDFKLYEKYYELIQEIKNETDYERAKNLFKNNLPQNFRILLNNDKNIKSFTDSPVGKMIFDYYKSYIIDQEEVPIRIGEKKSHSTLWGDGFSGINDITDKDIREIIKRIYRIGRNLITEFILDEMRKCKVDENHLEFEKMIGEKGVSYWIVTKSGKQRLNIYTKTGMNDLLIKLIGKKIYE
ncbi:MAG: putative CRISPR-associated protein [candidate division WOR-3 bacterium]